MFFNTLNIHFKSDVYKINIAFSKKNRTILYYFAAKLFIIFKRLNYSAIKTQLIPMTKKSTRTENTVSAGSMLENRFYLMGFELPNSDPDDDPIIIIPPKKATDPNNCVAF